MTQPQKINKNEKNNCRGCLRALFSSFISSFSFQLDSLFPLLPFHSIALPLNRSPFLLSFSPSHFSPSPTLNNNGHGQPTSAPIRFVVPFGVE
jgi:hypothetical protein